MGGLLTLTFKTEKKDVIQAIVAVAVAVGVAMFLIEAVGASKAAAVLEILSLAGVIGIVLVLRYPRVWPEMHRRLRISFRLDPN